MRWIDVLFTFALYICLCVCDPRETQAYLDAREGSDDEEAHDDPES